MSPAQAHLISEKIENAEMLCSVYLSAMIDAEGTVHLGKISNGRIKSRTVSICSTEMEIINNCSSCLDFLGVRYNVYDTKRKCKYGNAIYINITHFDAFTKLHHHLQWFLCQRKKDTLKAIIDSYKYKMKP